MRRPIAVLAAILLGGCVDLTPPSDPVPPIPGPVITVDRAEYSWNRDSVVRYTITNPYGVAVYMGCPNAKYEYYRGGWEPLPELGGCTASIQPRPMLFPGATKSGSLPLTNDAIPKAGHYRIVFNLSRTATGTELWPRQSRVSPSFRMAP